MTDKINQAVEEMRTIGTALRESSCTCDELEGQLVTARATREALQEDLRQAERKLKGAIFEETQG